MSEASRARDRVRRPEGTGFPIGRTPALGLAPMNQEVLHRLKHWSGSKKKAK